MSPGDPAAILAEEIINDLNAKIVDLERKQRPYVLVPMQELIERIMTEHWDIGACPCTLCVQGRAHGFHPKDCYPTNPKVSILYDGSKERRHPVYDWTLEKTMSEVRAQRDKK